MRAIDEHGIDLVILGTRGLSKIPGVLLGSVSEWVLGEAPCSVLILRAKTCRKGPTRGGMRLLLATDGSPDARAAVDLFKLLGFPSSSELTILHVVEKQINQTAQLLTTSRSSRAEFEKLAEDIFQVQGREGTKLLEATRNELNRPGLKIVENLAFGHEVDEILKTAKRIRADLVVVGSKGLTGLRRFLLGSVSHKVARHAPCSVMVVRKLGSRTGA